MVPGARMITVSTVGVPTVRYGWAPSRTGRHCADVRSRRVYTEPAFRQRILDAESKRERVARLRMDHVLHHDPVWAAVADCPPGPAHETVDGVAILGLVERQLVSPALELVDAVLEPVWPRAQHLATTGRAHLVSPVPVEVLVAVRRVRAEPTADLDDHRPLPCGRDLELLAGGREERELAWIESLSHRRFQVADGWLPRRR